MECTQTMIASDNSSCEEFATAAETSMELEPSRNPSTNEPCASSSSSVSILDAKEPNVADMTILQKSLLSVVYAHTIYPDIVLKQCRSEFDAIKEQSLLMLIQRYKLPHCVRFLSRRREWLAFERAPYGDLLHVTNTQPHLLTHNTLRSICLQILQFVAALNEAGYMHLDIKLENILVMSIEPFTIQIADFGFVQPIDKSKRITSYGTPGYRAPEIMYGSAYKTSDIWSLGVALYCLYNLHNPFIAAETTKRNIRFKRRHNDDSLLEDFGNQCLRKSPTQRPTAAQLLLHEWFK